MALDTLLVRSRPGETRIARVDSDGRLADFALFREGLGGLGAQVFLGRVVRVEPAMEAAFVDIGEAKAAFLGLAEARQTPHFGPGEATDRIGDHVHEGQALMVQVLSEPHETKGCKITARPRLAGDLLVFEPGEGISARVSNRIRDKAERARLLELALGMKAQGVVVVRSAAEGADETALKAELDALTARWAALGVALTSAKPPARLSIPESPLSYYLGKTGRGGIGRIVSDDPGDASDGVEAFDGRNDNKDIFEAFNIADQVEGLLRPNVALASGGSIIIEETAALSTIDVNSGSSGGRGGRGPDLAQATNLEAVVEAARHIRLRNLGGLIVVDLLSFGAKAKNKVREKKVLSAFRAALASDPLKPRLLGVSAGGLAEVIRPRKSAPLSHIVLEPCPTCDGGRALSNLSQGLKALERVLAEVRAQPNLIPALVAHPGVIKALNDHAPAALVQMEAQLGQPLELVPDASLKPGALRVDAAQR